MTSTLPPVNSEGLRTPLSAAPKITIRRVVEGGDPWWTWDCPTCGEGDDLTTWQEAWYAAVDHLAENAAPGWAVHLAREGAL